MLDVIGGAARCLLLWCTIGTAFTRPRQDELHDLDPGDFQSISLKGFLSILTRHFRFYFYLYYGNKFGSVIGVLEFVASCSMFDGDDRLASHRCRDAKFAKSTLDIEQRGNGTGTDGCDDDAHNSVMRMNEGRRGSHTNVVESVTVTNGQCSNQSNLHLPVTVTMHKKRAAPKPPCDFVPPKVDLSSTTAITTTTMSTPKFSTPTATKDDQVALEHGVAVHMDDSCYGSEEPSPASQDSAAIKTHPVVVAPFTVMSSTTSKKTAVADEVDSASQLLTRPARKSKRRAPMPPLTLPVEEPDDGNES
ncbi:unnamed protein product [Soboliphyme baturini]|uniref:Secreted protein n=1 Tax=Soboliphyme baturini TaxID=241478 RepID=A0A183IHU1_9BILA|nr:unnamed protein product [Soboliphyme baturini]